MILAAFLLLAISLQRILELRLATRNRAIAMAHGGKEYGAEHYWMFFVLHVSWLASMIGEAFVRDVSFTLVNYVGVVGFIVAELLRYWAIRTLGTAWNTRIIVIPGGERVTRGPYRFMSHPNYVAVAIEIAAVPLILGSWWTCGVFTVLNAAVLLLVRIPAEERALAEMKKPLT